MPTRPSHPCADPPWDPAPGWRAGPAPQTSPAATLSPHPQPCLLVPGPLRNLRLSFRPFTSAALLCLAACASPGPPQPPTLHLPTPVSDLAAGRVGNTVRLTWTTPSETTDNLAVTPGLTAQVCRDVRATAPAACLPRIAVKPGPSSLTDALPSALLAAPVDLATYRVEIFNAAGRSAGLSAEAWAPTGPALPPPANLQLTPVERGVRLAWVSPPPRATVELDRLDLAPAPPKVRPEADRSPGKLDLNPRPAPEARLRVAEASAGGTNASGALDLAVVEGGTYRYTAQRLQTVTLAGHPLELRSLPSSPATVTVRDTFPPHPPAGLAAVPSLPPGNGPSATGAPTIDLSWEPGTEPDLAGYMVYRAPVSPAATPGKFDRLTPGPVLAPAFRDTSPTPGARYAYQVTAIDQAGNESAPGNRVLETAPFPEIRP